jgi:hypothetical protein
MKPSANIVFVFILALLSTAAFAQAPDWVWLDHAGDYGSNSCGDVSTDAAGNSYVIGSFYGSPTFGSGTLDSSGGTDICVFKMDSSGVNLWTGGVGGEYDDHGYAVSQDAEGNCYVAGSFRGTAYFGSTTLTGSDVNYDDIFVAKLNPEGSYLWAVAVTGPVTDIAYGLVTDSEGYSYVTGTFYGSVTFGNTTLTSDSSADAFVARISPAGEWLWARRCGGVNADSALGVCLDHHGNSYVAGWFQGTATFGATQLSSLGESDIFIAKLDENGNWLWARRAGGVSEDNGWDVSADADGNAYLTGFFQGASDFGMHQLTSIGLADVFVAKLDPAGNWLWANRAGGPNHDFGYTISVHSTGYGYVAGMFYGQMTVGTTTLTGLGTAELFVAKYDTNGNWQWAKSADGTEWDMINAVSVTNNGSTRVAGTFGGTAAFGDNNYTSYASDDIFLAMLAPDGTAVDDPSAPGLAGQSALSSAWPDPVRQGSMASVKVSLKDENTGAFYVHNLRGQLISSRQVQPGEHTLSIDSAGLPAGIYLLSLHTSGETHNRKLVVIK